MVRCFAVLMLSLLFQSPARAQVCDPATVLTGLHTMLVPGSGMLLQWDAVPGSQSVQLKVQLPSGGTVTRRIVAFERDQALVPESVLVPGNYVWRVQAACSSTPPYAPTPISAPDTFVIGSSAPCPATVVDVEGNTYATVFIGDQCWMQENLRTETYRNGDHIPEGFSSTAWAAADSGAWTRYNFDAGYPAVYGLLYNGYAVLDPRGLCPVGWHVPSDEEWHTLYALLDPFACSSCVGLSSATAGAPLKDTGDLGVGTGLWAAPNTGATNLSGFSGLPGGRRSDSGSFLSLSTLGFWWSSSLVDTGSGYYRYLAYSSTNANRVNGILRNGFSVRCLKDE